MYVCVCVCGKISSKCMSYVHLFTHFIGSKKEKQVVASSIIE